MPGTAASVTPVEKPATSASPRPAGNAGWAPPIASVQTGAPSDPKVIAMTSWTSTSSKLTVPLCDSVCAEASAASVKSLGAVALTLGWSLRPWIVTTMSTSSVPSAVSVTVTV